MRKRAEEISGVLSNRAEDLLKSDKPDVLHQALALFQEAREWAVLAANLPSDTKAI